jgi:hypothetical protein
MGADLSFGHVTADLHVNEIRKIKDDIRTLAVKAAKAHFNDAPAALEELVDGLGKITGNDFWEEV